MNKIKKVVIPVAGKGTRFLPITKTISKTLLPIVDTPVIQYLLEEAVQAGIKEALIIMSYFVVFRAVRCSRQADGVCLKEFFYFSRND